MEVAQGLVVANMRKGIWAFVIFDGSDQAVKGLTKYANMKCPD